MVKFLQEVSDMFEESIEHKIRKFVDSGDRGQVFTPKDLMELGSEEAIHVALHRLNESGFIKRIAHGIYYYPEQSEMFGQMPPDLNRVALALANRYKIKIQPSGAYAANLLGLSEQVPAKVVYLTDGDNKKIKIGKLEVIFKKTTPRNMMLAGKVSGLVVQALKFLGIKHIDEKKIEIIKKRLSIEDKKILGKDASLAPVWIAKIIKEKIIGN